ncbi:hypothetical protein [Telluribacter sp.]|uniref:hypothetical protein n=1 Tax=Telluribacter sp. TaxID=1978767 RepID=UPI002E15A831|nr:hypothetical protein [Telluribacter sp.]
MKKETKSNQETEDLYAKIRSLSDGISDIDKVEQSNNNTVVSITKGEYVSLNRLSRIYKYAHEKEYWVEFYLENSTLEDFNFAIKKVELFSNNFKIESNLILLLEKVPEYMAPPYGNRYFDTNSYNNFALGKTGNKTFIFKSRFSLNDDLITFKESDYIVVKLEINSLNKELEKYVVSESVELIESFKNMRFKNIQSIDEKIEWINND